MGFDSWLIIAKLDYSNFTVVYVCFSVISYSLQWYRWPIEFDDSLIKHSDFPVRCVSLPEATPPKKLLALVELGPHNWPFWLSQILGDVGDVPFCWREWINGWPMMTHVDPCRPAFLGWFDMLWPCLDHFNIWKITIFYWVNPLFLWDIMGYHG